MHVDPRIAVHTRDEILSLLSDEELAYVATAEQMRIPEGDEYLDLEHLERGVLQAEPNTPGKDSLPRAAVRDETWEKILTVLETPIEPEALGRKLRS